MNKYLKTYIRNRDISIEKKPNIKEYELDYIDKNNLDDINIGDLITHSTERYKIINIILNNQELSSKIGDNSIVFMLHFSSEPERDKVINIILNNKNLVIKINDYVISALIYYSSEPERDKVINIILNNQELVGKIGNYTIVNIISNSSEPEKVKTLLKKLRPDLNI